MSLEIAARTAVTAGGYPVAVHGTKSRISAARAKSCLARSFLSRTRGKPVTVVEQSPEHSALGGRTARLLAAAAGDWGTFSGAGGRIIPAVVGTTAMTPAAVRGAAAERCTCNCGDTRNSSSAAWLYLSGAE